MTAALPMGGQKITGMADPTVATDGANKEYVDTTTATFFSTGDVKLTFKITPDAGWIMANDGTIGNVGSGANTASVACLALYTLFWNVISSPSANVFCAVTGGLGASAAADWAGLKPMLIPKTIGRALGIAGSGAGFTTRTVGSAFGAETVTLGGGNLPPYTPAGTITNGAITVSPGSVVQQSVGTFYSGGGSGVSVATSASQASSTFTGAAQGGSSVPVSIMQPSSFINGMIKL